MKPYCALVVVLFCAHFPILRGADEQKKLPPYPYQAAPTMTAEETERTLVTRFGVGSPARAFHAEAPAFPRVFTETQKAEQRAQGNKIVEQIKQAAAMGSSEYTIPPGIFRLPGQALELVDVHDFTLHCAGVEFITEDSGNGKIHALLFKRCKNIAVQGPAEWDSESLAYTEGKITHVDPEKGTYDIELLEGYPPLSPPQHKRIHYFDPQGHILSWRQLNCHAIEALGGRNFRIDLGPGPYWSFPQGGQSQIRVGNLVALERFDACFATWTDSENMSLMGITCYPGGAHLSEQRTHGYSLSKDCRAIPRPGTNRLVGGQPTQYNMDSGTLIYDGCDFEVGWDDGVNLIGAFAMVARQTGPRELEISKHGPVPDEGSTLRFYDPERFSVLTDATVTSMSEATDQSGIAEINAYCKSVRLRDRAGEIMRVTLDRDVHIPPHAFVESAQHRADEVIIRNSYWADMNAQVLLLQGARKGLVENNLFDRGAGPALHIGFSTYWWEGPVPANFSVRNNVCRDNPVYLPTPANTAGALCVVAGLSRPTGEPIIHHILIEGNRIVRPSCSGIYVRNAGDVRILNNTIIDPQPRPLVDQKDETLLADSAGISLGAVSNTLVRGNIIDLSHSQCKEAIHIEPGLPAGAVTMADNHIVPTTKENQGQGR